MFVQNVIFKVPSGMGNARPAAHGTHFKKRHINRRQLPALCGPVGDRVPGKKRFRFPKWNLWIAIGC